jgi:hypothetical protein
MIAKLWPQAQNMRAEPVHFLNIKQANACQKKKKHINNIASLAVFPLFLAGVAMAQVPDWKPVKPQTQTPTSEKPAPKPIVKSPETTNSSPQTVFKAPVKPAVTATISAEDQSQELVAVDLHLASDISDYGPMAAYSKHLSKAGVLYDADGGTAEGQNSAEARFKDFPSAITLVRVPEKAMASANGGSSWGAYKLYRGTQMLSSGRYLAVWRKEQGVWKIVSELAAGKDAPAPILPSKPTSVQSSVAKEKPASTSKKLKDAFGRTVN